MQKTAQLLITVCTLALSLVLLGCNEPDKKQFHCDLIGVYDDESCNEACHHGGYHNVEDVSAIVRRDEQIAPAWNTVSAAYGQAARIQMAEMRGEGRRRKSSSMGSGNEYTGSVDSGKCTCVDPNYVLCEDGGPQNVTSDGVDRAIEALPLEEKHKKALREGNVSVLVERGSAFRRLRGLSMITLGTSASNDGASRAELNGLAEERVKLKEIARDIGEYLNSD